MFAKDVFKPGSCQRFYSRIEKELRHQRFASDCDPKPRPRDRQAQRVAELERENARLRDKLEKAQTIIDVQLSQLLESPQEESS